MPDTDSDADPDSSPSTPAPQTPPRNAKAEHYPWSSHHDAATPKSSPPASPSLNLHSLGMSPFSPMRRQFSSPFTRSSSSLHPTDAEHSEQEDLVQDSKDVLVQRLNDIAVKLNQQDDLREDSVHNLHAKVDEMERVLSTRDHPFPRRPQGSRPNSSMLQHSTMEGDPFWGSLTPGRIPSIPNIPLPTQKSSSTQTEEVPVTSSTKARREPRMSQAQASRVVAEAQDLARGFEDVISSLRARQEESDHIHSMLITRAERAAQRIIHLEKRIKEFERNEGEMEMLNLQIQLKAIEVQCLSYVPKDADEELRDSISTWKTEWSALKRRRARRKAGASEDHETPETPSRQSGKSPG
ncbi:hypothetical protein F4677DRAFT_188531 [Hypoxylon crocopeplum]|nr:hypothetical protein F4677DRAFT_188531 [Hypoxylon crocopeplum]